VKRGSVAAILKVPSRTENSQILTATRRNRKAQVAVQVKVEGVNGEIVPRCPVQKCNVSSNKCFEVALCPKFVTMAPALPDGATDEDVVIALFDVASPLRQGREL
jgi:hypothetical protein